MEHLGWDYEPITKPHYHIYPVSPQGEALLEEDSICLFCDRTSINSVRIKEIVERLESLAEQMN